MMLRRRQHGSHSTDHTGLLSSSLPSNPGKAIFMHKPSLITELYPPGMEAKDGGFLGSTLMHSSAEDLKTIVCNQTLSLAYITRPCPTELIQWLFQLMARSDDPQISTGALRSLTGLLQNTKKLENCSFSVPSVAETVDVLVALGAERSKLRPPLTGSGARVQLMPVDQEDEEEEAVSPSTLPHTNLRNLINYVSLCVQTVADYRVQDLEEMVLILGSLSLDRHHSLILKHDLQVCLHRILDAYPKKVWAKAVQRLSPQLACLSPHHHDRVILAKLISGVRERETCLLQDFCRWCLLQMVDLPKSQPVENGKNSDYVFLKHVLTSYHRALPKQMSDKDYYAMHSLLYLLQLYAPLSDLTFPCKSSKQELLSLLGIVSGSVREDPMRPITSAVKDALIRMKLELECRSSGSGSTQEKLTDIFSFSS